MSYIEILLVGVGLSMDAFAASICQGLSMKKLSVKSMLIIGLFFGGFQALMPTVGFLLGTQFEVYIVSIDHWVAFALLSFIGGKMLLDVIKGEDDDEINYEKEYKLDLKNIVVLAVATSIDALAVGISMAFLSVDIISAASMIGVTTFVISSAGVLIGHKFGTKYKDKATIVGGLILILIGVKILLEHLGIIA